MISTDPLLLFLAAIIVDIYAGDWVGRGHVLWHPSDILLRMIGWVDVKLNRPVRGERALAVRGALAAFVLIALSASTGWLIHILCVQAPLLWAFEFILIVSLVDLRRPWLKATELAAALERDGLVGGRAKLPALSSRDPAHVDVHEIARLGVEALATRFSSGLVGPVISYMAFGLAGLLGYQAAVLLSERTPSLHPFFAFSNRLAAIIEWPTSNIAALVLIAASTTMRAASPRAALSTFIHSRGDAKGGRNTAVVSAMAGALDLALEGPRRYVSGVIRRPWVGDGRARAEPADVLAAARLFFSSCLGVSAVIAVSIVLI